ncbi:hypothetical protein FRUB_10428 [Fimbriiglobus ruber]|uniref:DUF1559 domain-containing protein n=1 Tax=Fimbriiglobus ruber TaxID=1908690 RepID=A0A225DEA9_9BACT|nr:hypothetical protein FRUB_10428 [Fimbriiglobus ruber]
MAVGSPHQVSAQPPAVPAAAAGELPSDLALVPGDALAFAHVRVADVWKHESVKMYRQMFAKAGPKALAALDAQFVPPPSTVDRVTAIALPMEPGQNQPVIVGVVTFTVAFDPASVRQAYLPDAKPLKSGGKEYYTYDKDHLAVHFPDDKTIVFGDEKGLPIFLVHPAKAAGSMTAAIRQAAGKVLFAAVNAKKLPLPPELEHLPPEFKPLLQAEFATVSLDLAQSATVAARLVYATEADATAAEKALRKAAELARMGLNQPRMEAEKQLYPKQPLLKPRPIEDLPVAVAAVAALGALNVADEILADLPVTREGTALAVSVTAPPWATAYFGLSAVSAGLLLPAIQKVRGSAAQAQSTNNMKQIALAMHNYHDTYGGFPAAAIPDKNGKPLLSWRVAILPFIEQTALYNQFKLDEPWDSEHNKKLIPLMPKIYADPRGPIEMGKTHYKVFVGKEAGFDWKEKHKFTDYPDGTSNTIMAVAGGDPVVWTQPDDIEFDSKKPLPDLTKPFGNILAAMFDGSVRVLNPKISKETLKAAITRNGGEVIGSDW